MPPAARLTATNAGDVGRWTFHVNRPGNYRIRFFFVFSPYGDVIRLLLVHANILYPNASYVNKGSIYKNKKKAKWHFTYNL